MGAVVVGGGSMVGLSTAMVLARDGHDVTVLEDDPGGAPASPVQAWESWTRGGVAQFHQPHTFFARFRRTCDAELPGLTDELEAAGCGRRNDLDSPPPTVRTGARARATRRWGPSRGGAPLVEAVVAAAAQDEPGVAIRRGVRVAARPHIARQVERLGDEPLSPPPGPDRAALLRLLAA
jgi:2-polyprenyl-6-methoxyphenol hydroxylase-like FAD-dependent oxidoreductase